MATVDRWLLPDGIEEVLPPEAARIEAAAVRCWICSTAGVTSSS